MNRVSRPGSWADAKASHASDGAVLNPKNSFVPRLFFGGAVTLNAFNWGGFIENYRIAVEQLYLGVAFIAWHALVATAQRKLGPLIVIEGGRCPPLLVMTVCARGFSRFGKLSAVWVFMARLAHLRCSLELNLGLSRRDLVTSPAGYRAMDAP